MGPTAAHCSAQGVLFKPPPAESCGGFFSTGFLEVFKVQQSTALAHSFFYFLFFYVLGCLNVLEKNNCPCFCLLEMAAEILLTLKPKLCQHNAVTVFSTDLLSSNPTVFGSAICWLLNSSSDKKNCKEQKSKEEGREEAYFVPGTPLASSSSQVPEPRRNFRGAWRDTSCCQTKHRLQRLRC